MLQRVDEKGLEGVLFWWDSFYRFEQPAYARGLETFTNQRIAAASDFDGNGAVDDFVRFAVAFRLSRGDTGYDAKFDLSENGSIDFADFVLFAQAYGT